MKGALTYLFLLFYSCLAAQIKTDSVYVLPGVVKSTSTVVRVRTIYNFHPTQNLNDYLREGSGIYIKNYGSGQLASITVRGTSAAQTDILWNGVKLNSPSLGQMDASLLALGMNDQIILNKVSQTGNIGGSVNLSSEAKFDSLVNLSGYLTYGSFNTLRTFAKARFSNSKVMGVTRVSYMQSDNNYSFLNNYKLGSPKEELSNAKVQQLHFMQQFGVKINESNSLHLNLWLSDAQREIPPIASKSSSRESQDDYSLRSSLMWNSAFKKFTTTFSTALLHDVIQYRNPDINLDEKSIMQAFRNNFLLTYDSLKKFSLQFEVGYDFERAQVPSYKLTRLRHIGKLSAGLTYLPLKELTFQLRLRENIYDKIFSPFSPLLSLSYDKKLNDHSFRFTTTGSRNFRFPTLNDMYWVPGGNPNLETEKSWDGEVSGEYDYKSHFRFKATGFSKYITNWIQWLNNGSYWEPQNVKRVFTRGAEFSVFALVPYHRDLLMYLTAQYTFTRATNLDAFSRFDQSKGKQLIYVPKHVASATIRSEYKRFYFKAVNTYTDMVQITTDNTQQLKGYYLLDLELGKEFAIKEVYEIGLGFGINNVTNEQYQNVAQRPMPGINFEGTIRFQIIK